MKLDKSSQQISVFYPKIIFFIFSLVFAYFFMNFWLQEVTGQPLDFVTLGYRCLMDFIDDIPDIFFRTPVAGSKKDYKIFPAKGFSPKGN